jgi:hypothetical protein
MHTLHNYNQWTGSGSQIDTYVFRPFSSETHICMQYVRPFIY